MNANEYLIYLHSYCDHDSEDDGEISSWEWLEEKLNKCVEQINGDMKFYQMNEAYDPYRSYQSGSDDDKMIYMMALLQIIYYDGYRHRGSGKVPEFVDKDRLIRFQHNYNFVSGWLTEKTMEYHDRARGQLQNAAAVLSKGEDLKYTPEPKQRKFQSNSPIEDVFGGI